MPERVRAKLTERIAEQLERRILGSPTDSLHSIAALAREYGISYSVMMEAVHVLHRKDILSCRKGAGIAVVGTEFRRPGRDDAEKRLFTKLQSMIANGILRTGEPFPKIHYYASTEHCSPNTVHKILLDLKESGLAHKRGRRWIVGRDPSTTAAHSFDDQTTPTVILVLHNELSWTSIFHRPFTYSFVNTLAGELLNHRITISAATVVPPP